MFLIAMQLEAVFAFLTKVVENPDLSWDDKYTQVFSDHGSKRFYALLDQLNFRLEYYDPDTTYEEDVQAFYAAAKDKMDSIRPLFPAFGDLHAADAFGAVRDGLEKALDAVDQLLQHTSGIPLALQSDVQHRLAGARQALAATEALPA